jgi:hypothetical protein
VTVYSNIILNSRLKVCRPLDFPTLPRVCERLGILCLFLLLHLFSNFIRFKPQIPQRISHHQSPSISHHHFGIPTDPFDIPNIVLIVLDIPNYRYVLSSCNSSIHSSPLYILHHDRVEMSLSLVVLERFVSAIRPETQMLTCLWMAVESLETKTQNS